MTHPWRRYVALGDSFTEGLEDRAPDGSVRGWADRLAQHLADRCGEDLSYANLAVRGRLLRPIVAEQLEPALALEPDLVSLVAGGNDMLRPAVDPAAQAARREDPLAQQRASGAPLLLGTSVDTRDAGRLLSMNRRALGIFNSHLYAIAARHGAHVMNLWGMRSLRDWQVWAPDRIHLNPEGHERVSQAALVALGLEPDRPDWDEPLVPLPLRSRRERWESDLTWGRDYLAPWLTRRLRRTSTGQNRVAKLPQYKAVSPARREATG